MKHSVVLGLVCSLALSGPAFAICPSKVPNSAPEAVRLNSERLLCLQREADESFQQRKLDFDVMTLERSVQNLQLQRRLDTLPTVRPYTPPYP